MRPNGGARPPSAQASLRDGVPGRRTPGSAGKRPGSRGSPKNRSPRNRSPLRPASGGNVVGSNQAGSRRGSQLADASPKFAASSPRFSGADGDLTLLAPGEEHMSDDMQEFMVLLTKQKIELHVKLEKEEARRVARLRRQEQQRIGRFVGGESWKRPSERPHLFSYAAPLPVKYLPPFEQQAADRPARACEFPKDPAKGNFRDVSTTPRLFGDPPITARTQALLLNSARSMLNQRSTSKKSPRDEEIESSTPKEPRHARLAGAKATLAMQPWISCSANREFESLKLLEER